MKDWAALFLLSPAPGAVFRFLERRALAGERIPPLVLISEPAPPHGFRALFSPTASREILTPLGQRLSTAFPHTLTLLWQESGSRSAWGHTRWENGEEKESVASPLPKSSPIHRLLSCLPGTSALSPPLHWARQQGLPVERLPVIGRHAVPIKEYRTVATLDQRSLLVENAPCLYSFEFSPMPLSPPAGKGDGNESDSS